MSSEANCALTVAGLPLASEVATKPPVELKENTPFTSPLPDPVSSPPVIVTAFCSVTRLPDGQVAGVLKPLTKTP